MPTRPSSALDFLTALRERILDSSDPFPQPTILNYMRLQEIRLEVARFSGELHLASRAEAAQGAKKLSTSENPLLPIYIAIEDLERTARDTLLSLPSQHPHLLSTLVDEVHAYLKSHPRSENTPWTSGQPRLDDSNDIRCFALPHKVSYTQCDGKLNDEVANVLVDGWTWFGNPRIVVKSTGWAVTFLMDKNGRPQRLSDEMRETIRRKGMRIWRSHVCALCSQICLANGLNRLGCKSQPFAAGFAFCFRYIWTTITGLC